MKSFLLGFVIAILILVGGAIGYFLSGSAPVATSARPMPMETYLAKKALHAVVERDMPKTVPIQADEANYLAGVQIYKDNCAVCHGLPGQPKTAIAHGMFPKPPELMHGKGVTDDPPGETYWKVANGIRLTGMPGFSAALSQTQMWQVSLLLANADKVSPAVKAQLTAPEQEAPASH